MGGAGPGQTHDDDRPLDRDVVDLGVAGEQVGHEEAVLQQLNAEGVVAQHAERRELGLLAHRRGPDVEPLHETGIAEVVEARFGDRLLHHRLGLEPELGCDRRDRLADRRHVVGEAWVRVVVDAHRIRPCDAHPPPPNLPA